MPKCTNTNTSTSTYPSAKDLVGPFTVTSEGYTPMFTMVDRTTRWVEAVPVLGTSMRIGAEAFFRGWISRFGVPDQRTSDRGAQFTSEVWASLCSRLGIQHLLTSAYHPKLNGLLERFHRHLKEALRTRLVSVLGLRTAPKQDSNISSAEMVYGLPLTLPGEMCSPPEITSQEIVEEICSTVTGFTPLPTAHGGRFNLRNKGPADCHTCVCILRRCCSLPHP